jgi:hypothetical protein
MRTAQIEALISRTERYLQRLARQDKLTNTVNIHFRRFRVRAAPDVKKAASAARCRDQA